MAYEVKCNRCGVHALMEFYPIDIGYWGHPMTWLQVDKDTHLCPACRTRAVEPVDAGQGAKEGISNA